MNERETEVKFYVNDLKRLETRLLELGARLIQPRVLETNLRFDLPDESLRSEGRVLRLRRADDVRLTYKGQSEEIEGVRSREEIEFTVGDFETARQFIEALGYVEFATYEKFRATYELAGCHIMLDELPYGDFVEIEGEGVDSIRLTATSLGLDWEAAVQSSYLGLYKRLCADRNLDPAKLTFAALEGFDITPEMLDVRPADL
jgi:adenylate cyclase class 2